MGFFVSHKLSNSPPQVSKEFEAANITPEELQDKPAAETQTTRPELLGLAVAVGGVYVVSRLCGCDIIQYLFKKILSKIKLQIIAVRFIIAVRGDDLYIDMYLMRNKNKVVSGRGRPHHHAYI